MNALFMLFSFQRYSHLPPFCVLRDTLPWLLWAHVCSPFQCLYKNEILKVTEPWETSCTVILLVDMGIKMGIPKGLIYFY